MADTTLYLGNSKIEGFYLGNIEADEVYLGNDLIYKKGIADRETYTEGVYTYTYHKRNNGWSVKVTDPNSTAPITQAPLTSLKGKEINDMGGMFEECQATTIDLSNFDTSNIINMEYMFNYCAVTTIKGLNHLNTSNVTDMNTMFAHCQATSLDLSNFNTSKVTDISWMFEGCKATSLDLSSFNFSDSTNLNTMFMNCEATIGYAKDQATCDKFNDASVTRIPSTLHFVVKPVDNESYVSGDYEYRYNARITLDQQGNGTEWMPFPQQEGWGVARMSNNVTTAPLTTIKGKPVVSYSYLFLAYPNASIPCLNQFDTTNIWDMEGMFMASQATSLNLNSFNTSNVLNFSGMFFQSKVTTLDLRNFNTSSAVLMGVMFGQSVATIINVSSFDTTHVIDMAHMFYQANKITSLDLSSFRTPNVENMDSMFLQCTAKELRPINFDTSKVTNMDHMFWNCAATVLDLSSFDTSKANLNLMVEHCTNVKTGYARTQADANRLNNASVTGIPANFKFTVK